jgi:hypothetical protein
MERNMKLEERRTFKRVSYGCSVRCDIVDEGIAFDEIRKSVNISGGGIRIESNKPLQKNQNVSLEIALPGYLKAIIARGKVMWSNLISGTNDYTAGISFTSIDSYDRSLLLNYIHFGQ